MASIDSRVISQLLSVSTPNVSDALDRLGIEGAPQGILPIYCCPKIAGPAATLKLVPNGKAQESTVLGTLRAIASIGLVRTVALPDVPTVAESGLPGFEVSNWIGLFAPAGGVRRSVAASVEGERRVPAHRQPLVELMRTYE